MSEEFINGDTVSVQMKVIQFDRSNGTIMVQPYTHLGRSNAFWIPSGYVKKNQKTTEKFSVFPAIFTGELGNLFCVSQELFSCEFDAKMYFAEKFVSWPANIRLIHPTKDGVAPDDTIIPMMFEFEVGR